jgi:hypothetical protein
MMNLIYGFAAGLLFSMVILSLIIVYGRSGKTWDASRDDFNEKLMGFWTNSLKIQRLSSIASQETAGALQDILEELKKANELREGK